MLVHKLDLLERVDPGICKRKGCIFSQRPQYLCIPSPADSVKALAMIVIMLYNTELQSRS